MKPFKLGEVYAWGPSHSKACPIMHHWDKQQSSLLQKLTASAKTSEPPVQPTTTEPELNITSTDEKAAKIYLPTVDQSSAPHKSHPEVVTVPEQCWRSEWVRKSPVYLRTMSVTRLYIFCCHYHGDYCLSFIDPCMFNWSADRFVMWTHWFWTKVTLTFFYFFLFFKKENVTICTWFLSITS